MAKQLFKNGEQISGSGVVVNSAAATNADVVDTTGDETVSDGTETITVVTRDTAQTITGVKTLDNNIAIGSNIVGSNFDISHGIVFTDANNVTYSSIAAATGDGSFIAPAILLATGASASFRVFDDRVSATGGMSFGHASNALPLDADTLDDYEEGTWTLDFTRTGDSADYTDSFGTYAKIGSEVFVKGWFIVAASPTLGIINVEGLPFAGSQIDPAHFTVGIGPWVTESASGDEYIGTIRASTSGRIQFRYIQTAAIEEQAISAIDSTDVPGEKIAFQMTYLTNA